LLERPASASSRGNASTTSQASSGEGTLGPVSTITTATTPAPLPGPPLEPQHPQQHYHMMQTAHYQPYPPGAPPHGFPPITGYAPYPPMDPKLQPPIPLSHHAGPSNKRPAPQNHPGESPAKKKQSKWTTDEDAAIIELRGNGMKWEDISKHLPGRSAISCRLRFQNYLERRSEWDEEKKNKLARLYERYVAYISIDVTIWVTADYGLDSRKICGRRSQKRCSYPGVLPRPCTGRSEKSRWHSVQTYLSSTLLAQARHQVQSPQCPRRPDPVVLRLLL